MTSEVTLDALPYYDQELDRAPPALQAKLEREIELELRRKPFPDSHPLSSQLPDTFSSHPLLSAALGRASSSKVPLPAPTDGLDPAKYTVNIPSDGSSIQDYEQMLKRSQALIEHQSTRSGNVDLLQKYGANSWRISNFLLEQDIQRFDKDLEQIQLETESLNRARKNSQTQTGTLLTALEAKWTALISGNLQLELANIQLDAELQALRAREAELLQQLQQ